MSAKITTAQLLVRVEALEAEVATLRAAKRPTTPVLTGGLTPEARQAALKRLAERTHKASYTLAEIVAEARQ